MNKKIDNPREKMAHKTRDAIQKRIEKARLHDNYEDIRVEKILL